MKPLWRLLGIALAAGVAVALLPDALDWLVVAGAALLGGAVVRGAREGAPPSPPPACAWRPAWTPTIATRPARTAPSRSCSAFPTPSSPDSRTA